MANNPFDSIEDIELDVSDLPEIEEDEEYSTKDAWHNSKSSYFRSAPARLSDEYDVDDEYYN